MKNSKEIPVPICPLCGWEMVVKLKRIAKINTSDRKVKLIYKQYFVCEHCDFFDKEDE